MRKLVDNTKTAGVAVAVASAFCFGGSGPFAKPLITAGLMALAFMGFSGLKVW